MRNYKRKPFSQVCEHVKREELEGKLFKMLCRWRWWVQKNTGTRYQPTYFVLSNRILREIAGKMPRRRKELREIKGFGPEKNRKWGRRIVEIINEINTPCPACRWSQVGSREAAQAAQEGEK